jgi:hypothetical protein
MKRIKVRFNLGRGKNYMKWKITYQNGDTQYLDPNDVQLNLYCCQFKNNKSIAQRIYDGGHKVVCAWVLCDDIIINDIYNSDDGVEVSYNPRVIPNWMSEGVDFDNKSTDRVFSIGKRLYIK